MDSGRGQRLYWKQSKLHTGIQVNDSTAIRMSGEKLAAHLSEHGVTPTAQRLKIAEVLFRKPQHLSAEQILVAINREYVAVSKATVYNTLKLLTAKGLVREVIVDPARVFYDPTTGSHHDRRTRRHPAGMAGGQRARGRHRRRLGAGEHRATGGGAPERMGRVRRPGDPRHSRAHGIRLAQGVAQTTRGRLSVKGR